MPYATPTHLDDMTSASASCDHQVVKVVPDSYRYDLSHLTPIDRLPVELLIEIFVLCAMDPDFDGLAPITIHQVCRGWKDIVVDSPQVWQYPSLNDRRSQNAIRTQAQTWLSRSKNLLLDITIQVSNLDSLLSLLLPLLLHVGRWRRCTIKGKLNEDVDFTSFSYNGSIARFDSLNMTVRSPAELDDLTTHSSTFYTAPTHNPQLHSINVRLNVSSLPPAIASDSLRHLTIHENSIEVPSDPVGILSLLRSCRQLVVFHYFGYPHGPSYPEDEDMPAIVPLPNLRSLCVRSTCAVRTLLSYIHAPSLTELYLEHTNMEFDPDSVAPYPYEPEDGDSDDEAHDFSQSPWSDHATGMGLRSLITRSNPPLQVLTMDYADMRTKDFRWCFERLSTLQEFTIVASDMSDKVIAMLAPYRDVIPRGLDGDDEEDQEVAVVAHAPLRVRLPKLSVLELWNCQRLTGDHVVHALQARTRYTDQIADGVFCNRLTSVAIINCVDFLHRHAISLTPSLGNRLRIH